MASTAASAIDEAVSELKAALTGEFQHIIAFFSADYDAGALATALSEAFPQVAVSGCSTAGGIGPDGLMESGVLLLAFPLDGFRIHTGVIEDVGAFGVERASEIVRG
ncbi:MAG TPA: FIST N-terminal domain-containing protein, partial [Hyphomicrobium sp.]|nr:FIST N-terminal domain-containing protein [Hyphomicrobium sp.]